MAEDVRLGGLVAEADTGEMLDQVFEERVGEAVFVGPLRIAENAVEGFGVGLFDAARGLLQGLADAGRDGADVASMAILRNLEAVVLREAGVFLVAASLG